MSLLMDTAKPTKRTVALSFLCSAGIAALILVGIYPNHVTEVELDQEIKEVQKKIATQRVIAPIYQELLKRTQTPRSNGLDYPPQVVPAKPKDIEKFLNLIGSIAKRNKMVLKQITPNERAYLKESNDLEVNIELLGDFFHFRQLLIQLCHLAYLKEIDSVQIRTDDRDYTFDIRLILAQE